MQKDDWIYTLRSLAASKERLLILQYLGSQDTGVFSSTIAEKTGIKATTLSRMLRELEDAGFIHGDLAASERRGRAVRYTLQPNRVRSTLRNAAASMHVTL